MNRANLFKSIYYKPYNTKGVTLVELMIAIILLSLILTALYRTYITTQKTAHEVLSNQIINDEILLMLNKITDDVREANIIYDKYPKSVDREEDGKTINPLDVNNQLIFEKVRFDFSKDPTNFTENQVNYTKLKVTYKVVKMNPSQATGPYALIRETVPYNEFLQEQTSQSRTQTVAKNLDYITFFRVKNPVAPRQGNLNIYVRMTRLDKNAPVDQKYTVDIVTSIKERGGEPE